MRVVFLHGLESGFVKSKFDLMNDRFDDVLYPTIDYRKPNIFNKILFDIKEFNPDYIIGSSIGGWLGYCYSTIFNKPALLFNPAFINRSVDIKVDEGFHRPFQTLVIGRLDDVIDPKESMVWYSKNFNGSSRIHFEDIGHRIPIEVFKKYIDKVH